MKIIDSPWLAVDIGSDRTHVAFRQSEKEVQSVETLDGEFDSVFHVSKNNHKISIGRWALERLEDDPGGIVLLQSGQLKSDRPISIPDGRCEIRPTDLYTAMLRHVREYCELHVFEGNPVTSCILAVPHRNDKIRRSFRKIAVGAGFRQVLFRDAVISAATAWGNVWGETCEYLIVCNLAASHVSFSLLKSRHGGFERVENVTSSTTVGIDEIDKIILEAEKGPEKGPEAVEATAPDLEKFADLLRLKNIRRNCNLDKEEKFHLRLDGRVRSVYTVHFLKAAQIISKRIETSFLQYQDRCEQVVAWKEIPIALVGGGTNIPVVFETIEKAARGKVYWWGGAEEAVALGTAMKFLPKHQPIDATKEEIHFHQLYLKAETDNVQAQYYLGKSLEMGHGTATSPEEAFDWYLVAARSGFHKAKYRLANLIHKGLGTIHDEGESLRLLRESAEEGYVLSRHLLGVYLYENKPDEKSEALEWLKKAASGNFAPAIEYITRHFGSDALPPITKSIFDNEPGGPQNGNHSGESVYPDVSGDLEQAGLSLPTPPVSPPDTKAVLGKAFAMGLTAIIFLIGGILLQLNSLENPFAENGAYALFGLAAVFSLVTAFFSLRYFSSGTKPSQENADQSQPTPESA